MAALTDATNLAKQMEAAAIKPKQAISPPSSPTRSARVPTATSPARCFAPKDATDLKKQELAGSFSNFVRCSVVLHFLKRSREGPAQRLLHPNRRRGGQVRRKGER